ncbi:MAG: aldo/keto reductase [Halobacteriaceae archaeon]
METVEAGDATLPVPGVGTWQFEGDRCRETVHTALGVGYRHVDTAQMYGNEAAVGEAIADASVDREDVFLTTKVWRSNLRADALVASVQESLDRLGTGYLDLLLIHWPHPRVSFEESLTAMAELQDDGVVEHLGVSNFTRSQLREARDVSPAPIVTDQVMYHPYTDQAPLLEYCRQHDMAVTAYSPLAHGDAVDDPVLQRIGDQYGKSGVQVALRWLIQQDGVVPIPKATSRAHLEANFEIFDFELGEAELAAIDAITPGVRRRIRNLAPAVMRHVPL